MRGTVGLVFALTLGCMAVGPSAHAQAADPAAQQIHVFDDALVNLMKQAGKLGPHSRFELIQPVVEKTFDLAAMTRFAVGSAWPTVPPDQQAELIRAFSRLTAATYAHNFDGYNGETFTIEKVDTRGPDKLVHTRLAGAGPPTELAYRMRQADGAWKVIDVYYNGTVSSLLGQRSEYAATLASGGAQALTRKLNSRADELLRSH